VKIDEDDYYDGQSLEYDDGHDNDNHDECVPKGYTIAVITLMTTRAIII
jgi:hypothetical protein